MPAVRLGPTLRILWKAHRLVLRVSGGRLGGRLGSLPVLLLETTGRRSARPRSVGLFHLREGDTFYVVGSYAGDERDPAWALNLRADPRAIVTVAGRTMRMRARPLVGEARDRIFERFVALDPAYDAYRSRTGRTIPVFELRSED